jgi:hypothetical protein
MTDRFKILVVSVLLALSVCFCVVSWATLLTGRMELSIAASASTILMVVIAISIMIHDMIGDPSA